MADERIKDLPHVLPTSTSRIPHDSTGTGTSGCTAAELVAQGVADGGYVQPPLDDFDRSGADWVVTLDAAAKGSAKLVAAGAASGFPSNGVALLGCTVDSGSKATITRTKSGYVLGSSTPITVVWRFRIAARPSDTSVCTMTLGVISTAGSDGVGIALAVTNSTVTANLVTVKATVPTSEAFTLPAGNYYNARLTISETGTKVEVSANDGAYSTVLTGAVAPTQLPYCPYAQCARTSGSNGSGQVAIDFVDVAATRSASDAVSTPDDSSPFKQITGGSLVARQVLTSGTTITVGNTTTEIVARLQGGGGAGGGCTSVGAAAGAAGGGGAGGYAERRIAVTPGTTYSCAVGAGGTGASGADGGAGGDTTLTIGAATITAKGGTGGSKATASTTLTANAGGAASAASVNADAAATGAPGGPGVVLIVATAIMVSGNGGSSRFGGGGVGITAAATGTAATGYGAGGGGAATGASAAQVGGAGSPGLIIVDEYT